VRPCGSSDKGACRRSCMHVGSCNDGMLGLTHAGAPACAAWLPCNPQSC
jgi:hypothetical protein